jgi:hypothetical protein
VLCASGVAVAVFAGPVTRPPVSVGMAYGGSNRPNRPHALHGEAQDLTVCGAARIGLQRPSGAAVAMYEGGSD